MQKISTRTLTALTNFVYEVGILNRTPRSGLWFLGSGEQSVAEHLLRTTFIAYVLCHLVPEAKKDRVLFMSLVHDIGEGRTSDLNYVHQRYGKLSEANAVADLAAELPFGGEIKSAYEEEQSRTTLEAKIVKDADMLEWIATLREEEVKGNRKAKNWITIGLKRLKTNAGKEIGARLLAVSPDAWWFDVHDAWFVDRGTPQSRRAVSRDEKTRL